jgi:hypothetical protein
VTELELLIQRLTVERYGGMPRWRPTSPPKVEPDLDAFRAREARAKITGAA